MKSLPRSCINGGQSREGNVLEATIKEAAVEVAEDGTKTYKVTLVDAAGTENPVLFNEKGEVQK